MEAGGYGWLKGAELDLSSEESQGLKDLAPLWDGLVLDPYREDGDSVRFRRYSQYDLTSTTDELVRLPHESFRQETAHNPLHGGQDREFEPCPMELDQNPYFLGLVGLIHQALPASHPHWHVRTHMVRIPVSDDKSGEPAPEGPHQDGYDYIAVHLVGRREVEGGVTSIREGDGEVVTATLAEPGDGLILDDRRFTHYTSPITLADGSSEGSRDVFLFGLDPART